MSNPFKRFVGALMAVVMLVAMVPSQAFAVGLDAVGETSDAPIFQEGSEKGAETVEPDNSKSGNSDLTAGEMPDIQLYSTEVSGAISSTINWSLDFDTETLTLTGTGLMDSFSSSSAVPWNGYCTQITRIELDPQILSIGSYAFSGCTRLETIVLPENLISIGSYAFSGCTNLTAVELPSGLTSMGGYAFQNCSGLTGIVIPESLTSISTYAFYGCSGLTAVELPSTLTNIGNSAFYGCRGLTNVTIPNSVISIEAYAFDGCTSLADVYYTGSEEQWGKIIIGSGNEPLTNARGKRQTVDILESDVEFRGSAKWDNSINAFVLTEDRTWQDGSIWFSQIQNDVNFEIELEVYTGNKNGADGLVIAFFADKTKAVEQGEGLGFNGCNGYGIELDTYYNSGRGDPSYNHLALLDGNVNTHRTYTDARGYTEDGQWHKLKIVNKAGLCTIYVDDNEMISYSGITPKSTFDIGVTAATGDFSNVHAVRNIKLTESGLRTYTDRNGTILYGMYTGAVIGYSGNPTNIYIPEYANGTRITSIFSGAFASCTSLRNIFVAAPVAEVAADALPSGTTVWGNQENTSPDYVDPAQNPYSFFYQSESTGYRPFSASPAVESTDESCVIGGKSVTLTFETLTPVIIPMEVKLSKGPGTVSSTSSYATNSRGGITYTFNIPLEGVRGVETAPYAGQSEKISFEFCMAENRTSYSAEFYLDQTPPPAIVNLLGSYENGTLSLAWTSPNADGTASTFNIYESDSLSGPWTKTASGESRADNQEMSWSTRKGVSSNQKFYYVTTVDIFGQESTPSNTIAVGFSDTTVPTDILLTRPVNNATISGTEEFAASAKDDSGIASYTINVRREDGSETAPIYTETWNASVSSSVTTHSVDFANLSSGQIFVELIATDLYGNSASSQFIYEYTLDNDPPPKVTGLSATSSASVITLRWNDFANEDKQDFSHFEVQWADGDSPDVDTGFTHSMSNIKTLGANITSVNPDTAYTFRVRAVDVRGNKGEWSDVLTAATISDTQAPVVAVAQPPMGRYKDRIPLSYSIDDNYGVSSVRIMVSQDTESDIWEETASVAVNKVGTRVSVNYSLDLSGFSEGVLRVRPVAIDFAGNESDQDRETAPFVDYIVDRTAPSAPVVTGAVGNYTSILVQWEKGTEEDLGAYSVFRSTSESGDYTQIASNLKSVDYIDSSITPGTTYYYKIRVNDLAGNVSDFSAPAASTTVDDDVKPEVLSVSPSDGYTLGPIHSIKASLSDNVALGRLTYRYSATGFDSLGEAGTVSLSGKSKVVAVPIDLARIAGSQGGGDLYLEISCTDASGNASAAVRRHYRLDWTPPAAPVLTVTQGNFKFDLAWTIPAEGNEDLAGFKIFRSSGSSSGYAMIGQRSRSNFNYTDPGLAADTDYYYYIEAMDENGNIAQSNAIGPVRVDATDTTQPEAVITAPDTAMAQTPISFSASKSTDNVGIVRYSWDLGDGTEEQSGAQITHEYAAPGSYTITLKAADAAGNIGAATHSIAIADYVPTGTVRIAARDENGNAVSGAGIYFDLGTEKQQFLSADNSGNAVFTAPAGVHTVGGYLDGYLPDKKEITVEPNQTVDLTLYMAKKNIVAGTLDVKEMTLDEIIEAGIDIRDPANQQVYEFTIQLTYGSYSDKFKVMTNSSGAILSEPQKVTIVDSAGPQNVTRNIVIAAAPAPTVTWKGQEVKVPTVVVLDLPGTASWLKDFFDVRLTVINQADEAFYLDDCVATLNVPDGLTLLDTNRTTASPVVSMGTIQGQHQHSAEWILRGDRAGSYDLTADFTSILREFGVTVNARFQADQPIEVRAGDNHDMVLEVIAENMIVGDADGAIRVGLRNDGRRDYNMVNLDLSEYAELGQHFKMRGSRKVKDTDMRVLAPGETLYWDYVVPRANWETLTYYQSDDFYLMNAAVNATGGNATLKSEITEVMPFTILADKIEVSAINDDGSLRPIHYVSIQKKFLEKAKIPDLMITTYKLSDDGVYEPCPLTVTVNDEYLKAKDDKDPWTVTTGEDGTAVLPGYTIDTNPLKSLKSYTIKISSSRARPFELPVNVYDNNSLGNLTVYVYQDYTNEEGKQKRRALEGAKVSLPDVTSSGTPWSEDTGKDGIVRFANLEEGPRELLIEKDGFLAIQDVVEIGSGTKETYYVLREDDDPNASIITRVKNSFSEYTQGTQLVFPKGHAEDCSITFTLETRVVQGETFDHFLFRIVDTNGRERDSGSFSSFNGWYYNTASLQARDTLQFALVTRRADGSEITSGWVDSGLEVVPEVEGLGVWVNLLEEAKSVGVKSPSKEIVPLKLGSNSETVRWANIFEDVASGPSYSDDEKALYSTINGMTIEEKTSKWTLPVSVKYDLSGKFIFTVKLKDAVTIDREKTGTAHYDFDTGLFDFRHRDSKFSKWKINSDVSAQYILRYDKTRDQWLWSMSLLGNSTQSCEFKVEANELLVGGVYAALALEVGEHIKAAIANSGDPYVDKGVSILPQGIMPEELNASGKLKVSAGGHLVTKNFASTGIYGYAQMTPWIIQNYLFAPKLDVKAAWGLEWTALWVFGGDKDIGKFEKTLAFKGNSSNVRAMLQEEAEPVTYTLTDKVTRFEGSGAQLQLLEQDTTLVRSTLLETKPLLATLPDGDVLMVYGGGTGDPAAPSALYYSILSNGVWSDPLTVCQDTAADINPYLASTSTGAILVWNDFGKPLSDLPEDITNEYLESNIIKNIGVSFAEFDSECRSWADRKDIAQAESQVSLRPAICRDGTATYIAWITNSEGALNGSDSSPDSVGYVILGNGGEMITSGTLPVEGVAVNQIAFQMFDQGAVLLASVSDASDEQHILVSQVGASAFAPFEQLNSYGGSDGAFAAGDDGWLYYASEGRICRTNGQTSAICFTENAGVEHLNGIAAVKTSGGTVAAWIAQEDTESRIRAGILDSNGRVIAPATLFATEEGSISDIELIADGNQIKVLYRYNSLNDDGAVICTIESFVASLLPDLHISEELVSHSGYMVPGVNLSSYVSAENRGLTAANGMIIAIHSGSIGGPIIAQKAVANGLEGGIEWTVPNDYSGELYFLTVEPLTGQDMYGTDNSVQIANVLMDIGMESACFVGTADDHHIISLRTSNLGLVAVEAPVISVYDLGSDSVVASYTLDTLAPGEFREETLLIPESLLPGGSIIQLRMEEQEFEVELNNNLAMVYVEADSEGGEAPSPNQSLCKVISYEVSGNTTEVKLEDPDHVLSVDSVIYAARYDSSGQMIDLAVGVLDGETVRFQAELSEQWTLFFLNTAHTPVCPSVQLY